MNKKLPRKLDKIIASLPLERQAKIAATGRALLNEVQRENISLRLTMAANDLMCWEGSYYNHPARRQYKWLMEAAQVLREARDEIELLREQLTEKGR